MSHKLIVIDGPSCVGKTELARALQEELVPSVWLNFSIDSVIYTLPPSILDAANNQNDWDSMDVAALIRGAFACVVGLSNTGNHVIFDVVISTERRARELQDNFADLDTFYIGVEASWECLEARVNARPDRTLDEVAHGYRTSPKHLPYDLVLDTTHDSPTRAARIAIESMRQAGFLDA